MIYVEMGIVILGWLVAQIVFGGYESHVPYPKRLAKLTVLVIILGAVRYFGGRWPFYGLLALTIVAIAYLHVYWFHICHGIHWRTAEPREKYLQLFGASRPSDKP